MTRRGLVSKGMGQGPQSGASALMPKGEKPKGPQLLSVADVARRLRVDPSLVEGWLQKGQLRGGNSGIRPYDFDKFRLEHPEEIRRAQQDSAEEKTNKTKQKPKKSLLSKFKSLFGGGDSDDGGRLAQENKRLKAELQKLQKSTPPGKPSTEIEEKIRFLEKQVSESRTLESEVAALKRRLAEQPETPSYQLPARDEAMAQELEEARRELLAARESQAQGDRLREALQIAQQEREELISTIEELKQRPEATDQSPDHSSELQGLQHALQEREQALAELEQRAHQIARENEELREAAQRQASLEGGDPLIEDLLELQRCNLERFKRLHALHQQVESQSRDDARAELNELRARYEAQLQQQNSGEEARELLGQLSESRAFITQLKSENQALQEQLASSHAPDKVQELEAKLREALQGGSDRQQMETELHSLRKAMDAKENQIQKVASRLSDNEKRLAKAMQESARLTELLIERENRLREVSEEYEQEYRDKLENLDRQVSGLQWKLSLREERIAHLESELHRKS